MDKITSLVEARKQLATQESCEGHPAARRWPDGVTCPRCGSKAATYMESRHQWQCECRYQFSVTSGSVFHKTHIDLPRWLMAVWLVYPFSEGDLVQADPAPTGRHPQDSLVHDSSHPPRDSAQPRRASNRGRRGDGRGRCERQRWTSY